MKIDKVNCIFYNTYALCEHKKSAFFARMCPLVDQKFMECKIRITQGQTQLFKN